MTRLLNDLLMLSNADAGNWSIILDKVEVDTLYMEVYETFYEKVKKRQHPFNLELPEEKLSLAMMDKERVKQVLSILIHNALSYTPIGKGIELLLEVGEKHLYLHVRDHGNGLSDEDKKHIFERFYRRDKARHEKNHYGLGLSIAYEIVRLHQGKLYVKDTVGGGCDFIIELPYEK